MQMDRESLRLLYFRLFFFDSAWRLLHISHATFSRNKMQDRYPCLVLPR